MLDRASVPVIVGSITQAVLNRDERLVSALLAEPSMAKELLAVRDRHGDALVSPPAAAIWGLDVEVEEDAWVTDVPLWSEDGPLSTALRFRVSSGPLDATVVEFLGESRLSATPAHEPDRSSSSNDEDPERTRRNIGHPDPDGDPMPKAWRPHVDRLIALLRQDSYHEVSDDPTIRISESCFRSAREAIRRYPDELIEMTPDGWRYALRYSTKSPGVWMVLVDLWTARQGRSDLKVEGWMSEDQDKLVLEVDSVRIM